MQRTVKLGLYGLVLAGLCGGTAAWATGGKTVDVRIDGQDRQVHTTADNVQGVLKSAHIAVGAHDIVAPDLTSPIGNNGHVVVRRGHLLHLTVDGVAKDVWVNADTVSEALSQLGYGPANLVSVSRSSRLDAGVTQVAVNTPKHVTFKVAGKTVSVVSGGPTVADALRDAHLTVGAKDRISASRTSAITDGEVVTVQRVTYRTGTETVDVPFKQVQQDDPNNYVGVNSVAVAGKDGSTKITYQLVYVDGKLAGKVRTGSTVLSPVVNQVNKVGSKQVPVGGTVPAGTAQQIAAGMVAARGWGSDQFSCLVSLWNKESGWRTDAANPSGAYGIPQALPGDKMASAGANWQSDAATQITWGLGYIAGVYGTPCSAWAHSQATNWY